MLGHPLKGVNKDLLPLGAGRRTGEGREGCSYTTQQKINELFLDKNLSTFNRCQTVSKALVKSIVYKPSGSPLHSLTCVCDSPSKYGTEWISVSSASRLRLNSSIATRFLSILTKFFQRHQNTLFWAGTEKKISQRVGRGSRFFGCEKHFKFFSSFKLAAASPYMY